MVQVLVLNASYEPLNITSWKRATVLMLKGKAEPLEHNPEIKIRSNMNLPSVIRLKYFVKVPYKEITLNRKNIFQRDNNQCQYCGYSGKNLSVDHILPRSRGGLDSWENVTTACLRCNVSKGNKTPEEAGMSLERKSHRPPGNLSYEANRQLNKGKHIEWRKYIIGWNN